MKPSTLVLGTSIALNAALAAFLLVGFASGAPSFAPLRSSPGPMAVAKAESVSPTVVVAGATDPDTWAKLQTSDLPALVARLREEGFPPAMIRAIMAEQVRLQFAPRRAALNLKATERPFWEPATHDAKTDAMMSQIMKEQNQAFKDLMGPDAAANEASIAMLRGQFPALSDDKIAGIARAQQNFAEQQNALMSSLSGGGVLPPDLSQKLTELEKNQRSELAKILTPQELDDYNLRNSNTANNLRYQLLGFDATEQEFRSVYQIKQTFQDQMGPMYTAPTPEEMRARNDAQKQMNDQIKAALGDERYADYQRSNDGNYQQTSRLVTRLELPPETANQIYAMQQDLQQRARAVQTDRTLSQDDRNAQLAALATEAQAKVTDALGSRGFEAYKQYGGNWMQQLQPRPVAPAVRRATP